jgi:hypothetical protein
MAEISRDTISTITDRVLGGPAEWQSRPLDAGIAAMTSSPGGRAAARSRSDGRAGQASLPGTQPDALRPEIFEAPAAT